MKLIIIICLAISANLSAQDKYVILKPLTWYELQLYQLDSLKTKDELKLASTCPSTLKKLQSTFEKAGTHVQHILGTMYIWTEYSNSKGLKCLVKHDKIDSITQIDNYIINPNEYELLDSLQTRTLKSASLGVGLKEKGYYEYSRQANLHNKRIKEIPYEKYGGMTNLVNYMLKNKPSYKIDEDYVKSLTTINNNTVTSKKIPLYKVFELKYSEKQRNELIESVKEGKY